MTAPRVSLHCRDCGSKNVSSDATVRWDEEAQDWEVSGIFDCKNCDDCGAENDYCDERRLTDGEPLSYEERVQALEEQGLTRSDAQGCVDAQIRMEELKVKPS